MNKYCFTDDYSEGGHPDIIEALSRTNFTQQTAYGDDDYCQQARELISAQCGQAELPVFFVASGTLANIIILSSALRSHEAIISAESGHIALHETGAIEAIGHKIISVPTRDGKLTPARIKAAVASNTFAPHMAKPRLVYISNATELGTVYTLDELTAVAATCRANNLLLMLDGARLGAALSSTRSQLNLNDIARLTDIFWIGGTKAGALVGEAIVIPNRALADDFSFHIKQRGALLAKGRLLGLQFTELFSGELFFRLTRRANDLADKLSQAIVSQGYTLFTDTDCNQVFPILPNTLITSLREKFAFHLWEEVDKDHAVIRLVTSWATDEQQVDSFISKLAEA